MSSFGILGSQATYAVAGISGADCEIPAPLWLCRPRLSRSSYAFDYSWRNPELTQHMAVAMSLLPTVLRCVASHTDRAPRRLPCARILRWRRNTSPIAAETVLMRAERRIS